MRYRIATDQPDTEPVGVLSLCEGEREDGSFDLKCDEWFILRLTRKGQLELYGDLPDDIGLDVDEDGCIVFGPDSGRI